MYFLNLKYHIYLKIPLPSYIGTEYEREVFKKKITTTLQLEKSEDLFSYNQYGAMTITVPIKVPLDLKIIPTGQNGSGDPFYWITVNNDQKITIDKNTPGMDFLEYCHKATKILEDDKGITYLEFEGDTPDNMRDDVDALNEANYTESEDSIKFVKYDLGEDLIIESLRCTYSNAVTRTSFQAIDGYAHQYCGGHDITIEFSVTTKNRDAISLLVNLEFCIFVVLIIRRKIFY